METYNVILMHEIEQIYPVKSDNMSTYDEDLGYIMLTSDNKADINKKILELNSKYPTYKYHLLN